MKTTFCLLLLLALASSARAQSPAARVGDVTSHGGLIVGPGVPSVRIEGDAAAVLGDQAVCPLVEGGPIPVPHVGGPVVSASTTVFIGGKRAARLGSVVSEVGATSSVVSGAPTVLIGN